MSATAAQPPGPEAWQAQNMRLIAFPREPQYAVQQDWWRALTGTEAESAIDRRQKHEREESGIFEGVSLTLGIDLLRVQWTAAPRLDRENINVVDNPPLLGPL